MKILFLDIDGVLNAHEFDPEVMCGQIHPDKVARLNRVLRATGCKVVLSSAWRYIVYRGEATLMGMEWLLRSHGLLADRLIGLTRRDTMERSEYRGKPGTWPVCDERGKQIADWLADFRVNVWAREMAAGPSDPLPEFVSGYAVVDDGGHREDGTWTDLGIGAARHPAVITDGKVGITDADADRLIEILGVA